MTWVDLSSAFAYGSSPTSTQLQNLRDNLAAMAAGDSGAPQIQTAGLVNSIATTAKIADANITASKLKTGGGSASGHLSYTLGSMAYISMQDYTLMANIGLSSGVVSYINNHVLSLTYTARFALFCYWAYYPPYTGESYYSVYWRYVTASDKPFIYAIQNSNGEFIGVWECDDPPPDYWGCEKKPLGFRPPMAMANRGGKEGIIAPHSEIIQFGADREFIDEIRGKAAKDKKTFADILNGYDFTGTIFEPKTLLEF
jgi:hypothetical protein